MSNVVDMARANDLPIYKISSSERLDSHFFLQWHLKRWRGSEFRKTVDAEAGWYGIQLFFIAQDGTPIGTLPDDDKQLAFDLNLPLEQWLKLRRRDVSPLHNWHRVQCDNGEVRLAHPVVTEIAIEAIGSRKRNAQARAEDRMRKRLKKIREVLVDKLGGGRAAANEQLVNNLSDEIEAQYPGGSVTEKRVREAWEVVSARV